MPFGLSLGFSLASVAVGASQEDLDEIQLEDGSGVILLESGEAILLESE